MHQILPSSFVFAHLKALSTDGKYHTIVLLASIWHKMGIVAWLILHPIRIIRSFPCFAGLFGLLTQRAELTCFHQISDH